MVFVGTFRAMSETPEAYDAIIIGAGVIGLEMGSVWSRLGSKVTVLEYQDRVFPGADGEISKQAKRSFSKQGIKFRLGVAVQGAEASSDGVMVARGDLGVEMGYAELTGMQKRIIRQTRHSNKVVITATQMMESMINNPIPTRAEVSDVANAVMDGTDAVMLSAETAVGEFPVAVIAAMADVCRGAEKHLLTRGRTSHRLDDQFEIITTDPEARAKIEAGMKSVEARIEDDMDPLRAASQMDTDEVVPLAELRGYLEATVEMCYQATGARRVKNPRIWSMHDLKTLWEGGF